MIAAELGAVVFAGCLRNASSVATACREIGGPTLVIAAGERWEDVANGPLRPALEDFVGAGAILAALGASNPSPEATAAISVFRDSKAVLHDRIANCASGRELMEAGYRRDVAIAAELDISTAVPRLIDGTYMNSRA
jgi:2-phosphosulfolactate phosphatase